MKFTRGFTYRGFQFGFHDNQLYRLPTWIHGREYAMRKLPAILMGNRVGYRILRSRKSLAQIQRMIEKLEKPIQV